MCVPREGVVEGEGTMEVRVFFSPDHQSTAYSDRLIVEYNGKVRLPDRQPQGVDVSRILLSFIKRPIFRTTWTIEIRMTFLLRLCSWNLWSDLYVCFSVVARCF